MQILRAVLLAVGASQIAAYLIAMVGRIGFPYQLEWIEGAHVDEVLRILHRQPLFTEPSFRHLPLFYPPLYFYVAAAFSFFPSLFGEGFLPLRLLSVLSSFGFLAMTFLFVKKETGRGEFAFLATCLMAATYRATGSWFDIGRLDSFFLFIVALALFFIRFADTFWQTFAAAVFVSLAFFTKQTAAIFFSPFALLFLLKRKHAATFFLTILALCGGGTIVLSNVTDNWYVYYIYYLPKHYTFTFLNERLIGFWTYDILKTLPLGAFATTAYFVLGSAGARHAKLFYALAILGIVSGTWLGRLHDGGAENSLMPTYFLLSVLWGAALPELLRHAERLAEPWGHLAAQLLVVLCIAQVASLAYNPIHLIPTKRDWLIGAKVVAALKSVEGDVYAPRFGYLPVIAGKKTYAHISLTDHVLRSPDRRGDRVNSELSETIRQQEFGAIFMDRHTYRFGLFNELIREKYQEAQVIEVPGSKSWAADKYLLLVPRRNEPAHETSSRNGAGK